MPLKTRRNNGGGNDELIKKVIEKAINDYNKENYLSNITIRNLYISLMYFLISFEKKNNLMPINDYEETNETDETKETMIINNLEKVLQNFTVEELNEILGVDNFRVYSQIGYYISNKNTADLPKYDIPIRLQKHFNYGEINGGSFRRQRTIKVIRKY